MAQKKLLEGKVLVSERALIARINRKLKPDEQALKIKRGWRSSLGNFYLVSYSGNYILNEDVDPEALGRNLGVLQAWEAVSP
jgi:hypothetical protein